MVPVVGSFFTPIRLVDAFLEYDEFFALSRRRYVPPNFAELRHVLNIAQVPSPRFTIHPDQKLGAYKSVEIEYSASC